MATTLAPSLPDPSVELAPVREPRRYPMWAQALTILVVWYLIWLFTRGQNTLEMPIREHTAVQDALTDFRNLVLASRDTNPVVQFTYAIGESFSSAVDWCERMIAKANFPRPVPEIGWLGVTALAAWISLAISGWRIALFTVGAFLSFGAFGYWADSMDTLIITFVSVLTVVLLGMPLAVWVGTNDRADRAVSAVLDVLQTLPTFVYLMPIVLFFGIGASAAVVCTVIYALPPIIRIAGYGIRTVSTTTIEATNSAGQTSWQRLRKVQLPMARATIIVGLNQSIMAALSMATIAAFVNGPGLGKPVLSALIKNDVGGAFVPGMLIVLTAVLLDRATTAASERSERAARGGGAHRWTRQVLAVTGVAALVALYLSRTYRWAAEFPQTSAEQVVSDGVDRFFEALTGTIGGATEWFKDTVTALLLNPMQELLAESPWWLVGAAILALAGVFGGRRAVVPAFVCLLGIRVLGLWHDAMITLNMTLVGTVLVMVLALIFGVWMARQRAVDLVLRPLLDAGQTIPPFVFLIPVLALFDPTRFTAIVAGVIYAAPPAIKLVADGVRAVSPSSVEASRSTGATTWQEITKVQLPMARGALVLATNQGLLYVLAMVVIGGMVGAGALGYDVVLGTSRSEEWGKGAAAGLSIVLLGIMVDRIMRAAARQEPATVSTTSSTRRPWWRRAAP